MDREHLEPPDVKLVGLRIWVHGLRQENSGDPSDDWVVGTAHCRAEGADVWVSGTLFPVFSLQHWIAACENIQRNLAGEAVLDGVDPELFVKLKTADRLGNLRMLVKITPDHMSQQHQFEFELDQSYLPNLIRECKAALTNLGLKVDTR
jgi:hypothetical protein